MWPSRPGDGKVARHLMGEKEDKTGETKTSIMKDVQSTTISLARTELQVHLNLYWCAEAYEHKVAGFNSSYFSVNLTCRTTAPIGHNLNLISGGKKQILTFSNLKTPF